MPRLLSPLPLIAVTLAACASTPEPALQPPPIETLVTHYAGDPLRGASGPEEAQELELRGEDAVEVFSELYLVAEHPRDRYGALVDHVRMIVAEAGAEPLAARSLLTAGTRIAVGADGAELLEDVTGRPPGEAALAAAFEALSLPGVTASMMAAHAQPIELAGHLSRQRSISVEVWQEDPAAEELSLALSFTDVSAVVQDLASGAPRVVEEPRSEKLVLDVGLPIGGDPVVVFAPARFDPLGRLAYVLVIRAEVAPDDGDGGVALADRLDVLRAEIRDAALQGAERRMQLGQAARLRVRQLRAIDALSEPEHRRVALVELAGPAPLCSELALAADDDVVTGLCDRLLGDVLLLQELAGEREALEWRLEREAVATVSKLAEDGLSPRYTALLLRHTGQAGRFPGAIEDAISASSSVAGFYTRVLEENRIALEDSSPASRLRAYDWLTARGVEVPEYDPLASRSERRAALRAWADAEAEARAGTEEAGTVPAGAGAREAAADGEDAG